MQNQPPRNLWGRIIDKLFDFQDWMMQHPLGALVLFPIYLLAAGVFAIVVFSPLVLLVNLLARL